MKNLVALGLLSSLSVACIDVRLSDTGGRVSALDVQLVAPTDTGTAASPVTTSEITFNVIARDDQGGVWPGDLDVSLFLSFGGVLAGLSTGCEYDGEENNDAPIEVLRLTAGKLMGYQTTVPRAYGAATLWVEDRNSAAAGASTTIYFANPTIPDVSRPLDINAPNATFCTPFARKFVTVDRATGNGKLVVSSVFGNAFVVTDTGAPTFNSTYVFSFGKPPTSIVPGKIIDYFSGNVSKFNGFTEFNFPIFEASKDAPDPSLLPAPSVLTHADLDNISKMLSYVASEVRVTGKVCDPEPPNPNEDPFVAKQGENWRKFNQFVLDGDGSCQSINNFSVELPSKVIGSLDPTRDKTKTITLVGMLKNSSGQNIAPDPNTGKEMQCDAQTPCSAGKCVEGTCRKNPFNFWTLVLRGPEDVAVAPN